MSLTQNIPTTHTISRRGSTSLSDVDVALLHPNHVYIPTPSPPSPVSKPNSKRVTTARLKSAFQSKYTSVAERDQSILLKDVVQPLESRGLIAATISSGTQKWQGIVRVPQKNGDWEPDWQRKDGIAQHLGKFRRMDLKFVHLGIPTILKLTLNFHSLPSLVPLKSRGAALLALTGDVQFNREIRTRAVSLGLHLNEFGLWRWQENETDPDKKGYWELVKAETEEDVLQELGMEWIIPERRNFSFIVGKKANLKRTQPNKKDSKSEI
jgi:DNA polymerase beta